jgi:hypothetical protein
MTKETLRKIVLSTTDMRHTFIPAWCSLVGYHIRLQMGSVTLQVIITGWPVRWVKDSFLLLLLNMQCLWPCILNSWNARIIFFDGMMRPCYILISRPQMP